MAAQSDEIARKELLCVEGMTGDSSGTMFRGQCRVALAKSVACLPKKVAFLCTTILFGNAELGGLCLQRVS